jgi:hypothetical protein
MVAERKSMLDRRSAGALAAALCLLCTGAASAQQTSPANLDRVEVTGRKGEASKWLRAESQHFVVFSDTREEDVTALLDNLEKLDRMLRAYTQAAGKPALPEPKLTLVYQAQLQDLGEVDDGVPADAVGLYVSCAAGVQGFLVHQERVPSLGDGQLDKAPLDPTLSAVFEAYARHFLYRHTDIRTPAWFIEGFAQYFSTVRFSSHQMVVGRVPPTLAEYQRFLDEGSPYSLEYDQVLRNDLLGARNPGGPAGVRLEFSAKAWLLTHYMMSSEGNRRRLSRYLALVGEGASPTAAFERAFRIKVGDLGRVMWRYSLSKLQVLRVAPQELPAARVSFRGLPLAAGEFVLANAALKACPGPQAGTSLLKKVDALAARFPADSQARLTLSRAQIDWGDPQQALSRLTADLRDDDNDFEARYLAGMASLRLAARSDGDARRAYAQAARDHLQRARALNPLSTEAAHAFFRAAVAVSDGPDDSAVQAVISAWQSAREVDALAASAALAYAYTGRADEADRILGAMVRTAGDPSTAEWATQWQQRLEAGVTRGDILAEMRRDAAADAPFKEWTLHHPSVMRKVKLARGLEAAQYFINEQRQQQERDRAAQPSNNQGGDTQRR